MLTLAPWTKLASSPGHSHIFNVATLKIWEWPGDEAKPSSIVDSRNVNQYEVPPWSKTTATMPQHRWTPLAYRTIIRDSILNLCPVLGWSLFHHWCMHACMAKLWHITDLSSLVNQTPAFRSAGCTASPGHRKRVWELWPLDHGTYRNMCRANHIAVVTWLPSSSPQGGHIRGRAGYACAHYAHAYLNIAHTFGITFCLVTMSCDCIPVCHGLTARVPRPSFRVLVMEYIQCYGKLGLVHETTPHQWRS